MGSPKDETLDYLLQLNGEVFPMDNDFWTKFEVHRVIPNKNIPHGIKYSLTLHDKYSQRILGFDNAHGCKPKKKKYGAQKITWDHKHKRNEISPYEFESAGQLLEDFWVAVDKLLNQ